VCGAPDGALDLQNAVREAEEIFAHLCPGKTFFPEEAKKVCEKMDDEII
jgi:hypothetical protein